MAHASASYSEKCHFIIMARKTAETRQFLAERHAECGRNRAITGAGDRAMAETLFGFDEKAAARIIGIAPRTLRAWRKAGKVGHHLTPGGRIRYTMDQLLDLQRGARVNATTGRTLPQ